MPGWRLGSLAGARWDGISCPTRPNLIALPTKNAKGSWMASQMKKIVQKVVMGS